MENSHVDCNTISRNMQEPFRVDPEFANKIPPIGDDEFRQLRENILAAGEVYESLVVWNGVLVDGHNRWKIIRENPAIKYRVREMYFADKWAAFGWMYKNQLGRRNLTDEQRTYTIGKMYEARKKSSGGQTGNVNAEKRDAQSGQLVSTTDKATHGVSGELAIELNVGRNTVRRAEHFAKGVDALRKVNAEAADKVMNGSAKIHKQTVAEIAKMEPDEIEVAADAILMGNAIQKPVKHNKQPRRIKTDEERRELDEIRAIVEDMCDPTTTPEFTIDLLIEDIEVNADIYVQLLRNTLTDRSNLVTDENKPRIAAAIDKVVENIMKVRETL